MLKLTLVLLYYAICCFAPAPGVWFEINDHYYAIIAGANVTYYPTQTKKGKEKILDALPDTDQIDLFAGELFLHGMSDNKPTLWHITEELEHTFQLKKISPWKAKSKTLKFVKVKVTFIFS